VYGSKMNYAYVFVSHKGLTCILKTFVRILFGLCFKNNVGFVLYIVKQIDKSFHLNVNMIKTNQIKFLDLIPFQQVF
jgi:hypothetical protein